MASPLSSIVSKGEVSFWTELTLTLLNGFSKPFALDLPLVGSSVRPWLVIGYEDTGVCPYINNFLTTDS